MKTTLEIPDLIYRKVKACAALKGQTVRAFFLEAIQEKLNGQRHTPSEPAGWRSVFGQASVEEINDLQKAIDEEFSRIDAEDWK